MKKVEPLLEQFVPEHYTLVLKPDLEKMTFTGEVEIKGIMPEASKIILLHSHGLVLDESTFSIGGGDHPVRGINLLDKDEIQLNSPSEIHGVVTLKLKFHGKITNTMVGMYPSTFEYDGKKQKMLSTQFESHHAREVFPCVDEPAAKATFDLTLHTPRAEKVLANTPIASQTEEDEMLVTTFETTPKMSTYLLAFAYGDIDYLERQTRDGTTVRTWATPENVKHTAFALDIAVQCLEFYNEYFDVPYPLTKSDHLAVPDFSAGAMENWGLVTYRESALLVDPENTSLSEKQAVALVIAHELAHQWFGNLVTMQWWNDLWLNEGFATWIEYLAVDKIFPEWEIWSEFVTDEYLRGQSLDSLASSHPVEVDIEDPEEIRSIFDAISYSKGASVIRMLHAYLGANDFKNGLSHYLKRFSYENATTDDLWDALTEISDKPVKDFMAHWTSQTGFPLVNVEAKESSVRFSQQRYMISPTERADLKEKPIWPIPLDATDTEEQFLLEKNTDSWKLDMSGYPKFNTRQTGFYMTNYSADYLAHLGERIQKGSIEPLDRMGLLSDTFQLARAGYKSTVEALKLMESYAKEDNPIVWDIMAGQLVSIRRIMDTDELRDLMKPFTAKLVTKQLDRLGWDEKSDDTHFDKLLRPTILAQASFAEIEWVVTKCKDMFAAAKKPEDIAPELRGVVFGTVVRHGGAEEFKKLLTMYRKTKSAQAKSWLAAALTSFEEPGLIAESLNLIKSKDVKLQEVISWVAYSFSNRHAKDVAWTWLKTNWDWLAEKFGTDIMTFSYFPRIAAGSGASEEFAEDYANFFKKVDTTGIKRPVDQGLESILWHSEWKKRDEQKIIEYFKDSK